MSELRDSIQMCSDVPNEVCRAKYGGGDSCDYCTIDRVLIAVKAHIKGCKPKNPHKDVFINHMSSIVQERAFDDGVDELRKKLLESM